MVKPSREVGRANHKNALREGLAKLTLAGRKKLQMG